jgi:hypothetical protein
MWDYLVRHESVPTDMERQSEEWLQARGQEGWELVSIQYYGPMGDAPSSFRAVMKRPIEPRPSQARLLN